MTAPLPRDIVKWLQSLDLSLLVKNPKRDFANGFLVAEILSRYYKDMNMNTFENGQRLAAKVDNWEQLYRIFKKRGLPIGKNDFDAVIHHAAGAAVAFIFLLFNILTKRTVKTFAQEEPGKLPAFMRDTASKRVKDNEIARICDDNTRIVRAIDVLSLHRHEQREKKAADAMQLLLHERKNKARHPRELESNRGQEPEESIVIDEVPVKALVTAARRKSPARGRQTLYEKSRLTEGPGSAVGALARFQPPALFVKPAAEIMKPLVLGALRDAEDAAQGIESQGDAASGSLREVDGSAQGIESRKNVLVSFMETCRDLPEEVCVRVFEALASRAHLLVDTLTKSSLEFWRMWSTMLPALMDFPESSPVFESAVFFFKRVGELMREADPTLTQQWIMEVGLPSLLKELMRAPEKREALCEIIYSYTQQDCFNHILVLRALRAVGEGPYTSCLACVVSIDAQLDLLEEQLMDLYIYYALIAIQSPQCKLRVAGLSILSAITSSTGHATVLALLPQFAALSNDEWWEVQAQLLVLSAELLRKVVESSSMRDDEALVPGDMYGTTHPDCLEDDSPGDVSETLLSIIGQVFVASNSKNVLQIGLSVLVPVLHSYTALLPMYVAVLIEQPTLLRQRLLRPPKLDSGVRANRVTYVMGNSSRMYEETCPCDVWPHLDVAKTFAVQLESSLGHFSLDHIEVLQAVLPREFEAGAADEWVEIFEKVNQYIFAALVDPSSHLISTQIIKKFWLSVDTIATRCIEASRDTLLQALQILYSSADRSKVEEAAILDFVKDMRARSALLRTTVSDVIDRFKQSHASDNASSHLDTVLA
mmetsp:Transcript_43475/g.114672  ORF Transcript_43475/g.114672 Transcript_43475/m.114672 type:complete len:823 (-) Transcript_43475:71-2539(-)